MTPFREAVCFVGSFDIQEFCCYNFNILEGSLGLLDFDVNGKGCGIVPQPLSFSQSDDELFPR
jgi:hypothetical protein